MNMYVLNYVGLLVDKILNVIIVHVARGVQHDFKSCRWFL